jgi:hypothetical protein
MLVADGRLTDREIHEALRVGFCGFTRTSSPPEQLHQAVHAAAASRPATPRASLPAVAENRCHSVVRELVSDLQVAQKWGPGLDEIDKLCAVALARLAAMATPNYKLFMLVADALALANRRGQPSRTLAEGLAAQIGNGLARVQADPEELTGTSRSVSPVRLRTQTMVSAIRYLSWSREHVRQIAYALGYPIRAHSTGIFDDLSICHRPVFAASSCRAFFGRL